MKISKKAIKAKKWLNRNYHATRELDAEQRLLEVLLNRLGTGVATYKSDGTESHDSDAARARHEDALLEYSSQKEKVERLQHRLIRETARTKKAIDLLSDPTHRAVAIDRYINCLRWADVASLEHISIAQVYRINNAMLEQMADVLKY